LLHHVAELLEVDVLVAVNVGFIEHLQHLDGGGGARPRGCENSARAQRERGGHATRSAALAAR
jgi:hypothetical protein